MIKRVSDFVDDVYHESGAIERLHKMESRDRLIHKGKIKGEVKYLSFSGLLSYIMQDKIINNEFGKVIDLIYSKYSNRIKDLYNNINEIGNSIKIIEDYVHCFKKYEDNIQREIKSSHMDNKKKSMMNFYNTEHNKEWFVLEGDIILIKDKYQHICSEEWKKHYEIHRNKRVVKEKSE